MTKERYEAFELLSRTVKSLSNEEIAEATQYAESLQNEQTAYFHVYETNSLIELIKELNELEINVLASYAEQLVSERQYSLPKSHPGQSHG